VSEFALSVLKYAFLALLYFFVFRAIRAVVVDISGRAPRRAARPSAPAPAPRATRPAGKARAKPPTTVVVRGEGGKKLGRHRLGVPLQIGRDRTCQVRLDDTYVSQIHARLYGKDGSWYVEDLGSTNGTYLNRERVTGPREVHAGDEVRVGKTTLELRR
jgi:hypothetical protein